MTEMSVEELRNELKKTLNQFDELEVLEKDEKLKELIGISGFGLDNIAGLVALTKVSLLFARYFGIPPEMVELKKGGPK